MFELTTYSHDIRGNLKYYYYIDIKIEILYAVIFQAYSWAQGENGTRKYKKGRREEGKERLRVNVTKGRSGISLRTGVLSLPLATCFFIFSQPGFLAASQLTEGLEEAKLFTAATSEGPDGDRGKYLFSGMQHVLLIVTCKKNYI